MTATTKTEEVSIYALACLTRQLNYMMGNNQMIENKYKEFFERFKL